MAPVLNSISPSSGPPGTAIALTGTGFDASSQAACPVLVATTYVSPTALSATIPEDIEGAGGSTLSIGVYVLAADGTASQAVPFAVVFPAVELQTWTTVGAVAGEIPGFSRGGRVKDEQILTWMRTVAQAIAAALIRRGLSTDPGTWQPAGTSGAPAAVGVLELINRLGAGARLAAAVAAEWGQNEWGLSKNLERNYQAELSRLDKGLYDKLFLPGAATVEARPQLAAGDTSRPDGQPSNAFTKGRVF